MKLSLLSQNGCCLSNGNVHPDHELPNVLLCVQELPAVRPELERHKVVVVGITKIREFILRSAEPKDRYRFGVRNVQRCEDDHWQPLAEWHSVLHGEGPEVIVAVNLPLAHVKAVSNEIVRLWAVDSYDVDGVHVVSTTLKLIIIGR